jgi:hypothetical protein
MNTIVVIRDPRTLLGNRVRELWLGKELSQEKLAELHRNFVSASPSSKGLRQRWATWACARRVVLGFFQRLNTHILLGMIC